MGNFLIHLANSFLVYFLIYKTLRLPSSDYKEDAHWISFLTAMFFSLHPIQTGAVSYISQRAEIMASFFYLTSLLFFIRGLLDTSVKGHIYYIIGIICFFLGWGSKDIIITLPFTAAIYWFYFLRDTEQKKILQIAKIMLLILPVIPAIIYRLYTLRGDTRIGFKLEFTPYEYLLTQFRVITKYISLLFLPVGQNADYDFAISKGFLSPPSTLLSFMFLLFLYSMVIFLYRRWRIGSFALLWFFVILMPTSSVIPIIDVMFEHRVYLASASFFLLFSLGLYHVLKILAIPQRVKSYIVLFTILILMGSLTYLTTKRNMVWTSRISFWEDVVSKSPLKARSYVSLGSAYQEKGLIDFAIAAYSKATSLAVKEEKPNSMLALALLYTETGKTKEALSELKKAMDLTPINSPDLHYVIGTVCEKAGYSEQAIRHYKEAISKDSRFVLARYAIADLYQRIGLYDDAIAQYEEIIKIDPNSAKAYNDMGVVYCKIGKLDVAEKIVISALKIDPNFAAALKNLNLISKIRRDKKS